MCRPKIFHTPFFFPTLTSGMEGSESEAVFDSCNLNPQLFINEVLNAVDDVVDGAFGFYHQQASVITATGDAGADRSEELTRAVSFLRHLTQGVLDKRLGIWEKYCLRHCFTVPDGFVLPKAKDSSGSGLLPDEGLCDPELNAQLDTLRKKLVAVGQESADLQGQFLNLEKQSSLSSRFDASVAEVLQLYENSAHEMYKEIGKSTSKLKLKVEAANIRSLKSAEPARIWETYGTHDQGLSARTEDIQGVLSHLRNA